MKILSFLLLLCLPSFGQAQKNTVEITGWTNVSTFKCTQENFRNSPTVYSFSGNTLPNIVLRVEDFDCKNRMMTADFRKTLKSEQFPTLSIRFLNFARKSDSRFSAVVEVKMMTVSRRYTIEFSEYQGGLAGNKRLKFSDFQIIPPKKMGGVVYVKDEIDLFFRLAVK